MTVQSSVSRISYSGDGTTTAFSVNFYFLVNGDLRVIVRSSAGVETVQTLGTHYSVTGAGNPNGGTVTFVTAPANGTTVVIVRDPPTTQLTAYNNQDPFPASSHERALDKLTMLIQRREEKLARAVLLKESSSLSNLTYPDPEAGKLLRWNASANGVENATFAEGAETLPTASRRFLHRNAAGTAFEGLTYDETKAKLNAVDFATRADALAYAPVVAPTFLRTAFYDTDQVPGSGALYARNGTSSGDLVITLAGGVTAVGYSIKSEVLTPEMFGAKGGGVADDRPAFLALFSRGGIAKGRPGATYRLTDGVVTGAKIIFDCNGAKFIYGTERPNDASDRYLFRLNHPRSEMRNFEAEYPYNWQTEDLYTGVTGVQIEANYCRVEEAEVHGFSRIGVRIGAVVNVKTVTLKRVNSHHNKNAGVMSDNSEDLKVKYCELNDNGFAAKGGVGYGFAGNSTGLSVRTKLLFNEAHRNYLGLDFHAGSDGFAIGNEMGANRSYGINFMGVTGKWTIRDNRIWNMAYVEVTGAHPVLVGIGVGQVIEPSGGGVAASFHLEGNRIWDFSSASPPQVLIAPFLIYGNNRVYMLSNNDVDARVISSFVWCASGGTDGQAAGYTAMIDGGRFAATYVRNPSIYFDNDCRNFDRLSVIGVEFHIGAGDNLGALVSYQTPAVRPRRSVIVKDNSAIVESMPAWGESGSWYRGFSSRLAPYEIIQDNEVNGGRVPDWNGSFHEFRSLGIPGGSWNVGDRVYKTTPVPGDDVGWVCTTAGSPGTWKSMGKVAA